MKIVIICESFSENMGYADSCLPKYLAMLGHEVHMITSNTQVYFNESFYNEVYQHFLGPPITAYGTKQFDGYSIHRLPFKIKRGKMKLSGMFKKLAQIRPDIVQTFSIEEKTTFQAALYKPLLGYKLFTANHVVASVFPAAQAKPEEVKKETQQILNTDIQNKPNEHAPNKFSLTYLINGVRNRYHRFTTHNYYVNYITHTCYPATIDASDIATRFMGVPPSKIKINILGVDTEVFKPVGTNETFATERKMLREKHGFKDQDIVCIYTGRFTEGKNPLCLARAIDKLVQEGKPYRALFIGLGPQKDEISTSKGCQILPFMHYKELAQYYRAVDIGVWPRQESTSVLDATACGLPVVISDRVLAIERKEGNGLTYKENDSEDMKNVLLKLESTQYRNELGKLGIEKISKNQKWADIAKRRVQDYEHVPVRMSKVKQMLKAFVPPIFFSAIRRLKSTQPLTDGWHGDYETWQEAEKKCTGYNSGVILETCKNSLLKVKNGEAVYERDSVLFNEVQYSWGLLAGLERIALENESNLCVLDFGGSLGSTYYQNREFLASVKNLTWCIVEQEHFVDCGKQFFESDRLKFYHTIDECMANQKPNVLLLSGVLQYLEKPKEWIEKFTSLKIENIIVDRTTFVDSQRNIITVQKVPSFIYQASYPCWFFNEDFFLKLFSDYKKEGKFDSFCDKKTRLNSMYNASWEGYLFKMKSSKK